MPFELGGPRAWKVRMTGDIGVSYEWVNHEPCMLLFPVRQGSRVGGCFGVAQNAVIKYVKSNGHPRVNYAVRMSIEAAQAMGMYPDKSTCKRIIDVIIDGIEELVKMPPEPNWMRTEDVGPPVGELTIREGDRVIVGREITAPSLEDLQRLH